MTWTCRLDGKVAAITGSAAGIGRSYAIGLARAGAQVAVIDLDPDGEEVAGAIREAGGSAAFFRIDVSDDGAVSDLAREIEHTLGGLDILVNNAAVEGAPTPTPLASLTAEHFDRVQQVNVKGMWLTARALRSMLRASGTGVIVNQGSIASFICTPGTLPYNVSKMAILGLTKTLARELGEDGIRVNCLAPGLVATESVARLHMPDVIDAMRRQQCIQRVQKPDDLVDPLLFLVSSASRFITGQVLVVDGGYVMPY
jgi:NAD(P)-dependent dehydrogenase (short-subunit alcohol dehydrogenase family)